MYLYEDFPWLPYEGSGYSPADLGYIVSQVRPSPTHSLYFRSIYYLGRYLSLSSPYLGFYLGYIVSQVRSSSTIA